ncbi:MAG: hypothetical protein ACKVT0_06460 [Planctomycetaceae bacterium]
MSEYQYVAFRAVDKPVSGKDLEFMHKQSTRAEVTPWSFENEYHFGDFHGNALEMLRRGYDLHLHYANYGVRKLCIRLPNGFTDVDATRSYLDGESIVFTKDKQGGGGILEIQPFYESDDLDELWNADEFVERLIPLRAEILDGDLRPLYLAHLAVCCDANHDPDEETEGPIPAGMNELTDAQQALAEFLGIDENLILAVAQQSPPLLSRASSQGNMKLQVDWLFKQSVTAKDAWLLRLLDGSGEEVRREILDEIRKSLDVPGWPTIIANRTLAELHREAESISAIEKKKKAELAARKRTEDISKMKADPNSVLRETENLVDQRSTTAYRKIAKLLADLREALADSKQAGLAEQQAEKLRRRNPTLRLLVSELRKQSFLTKSK